MRQTTSYADEEKLKIINRTLPPENISVPKLSAETGIPATTLYGWTKKFKQSKYISATAHLKKNWSAEDKFHVVLETYHLNEIELGEYCRNKGLYVEQVKAWHKNCIAATDITTPDSLTLANSLKEQTNKVKELEKDLARKNKALAETAALLVLKKKAQAIWGEEENL